jgi:cytochrome P450
MIPNHALQNDSKYFPNPERFDPERFSDDDALHKYQYIYSPFGEGPRQCIGTKLSNNSGIFLNEISNSFFLLRKSLCIGAI